MYKRKISKDKENRLIDTKALAAYLGIGYNTASAFGKEHGAAVRIGTRLLFDKIMIDKALDAMRGNN